MLDGFNSDTHTHLHYIYIDLQYFVVLTQADKVDPDVLTDSRLLLRSDNLDPVRQRGAHLFSLAPNKVLAVSSSISTNWSFAYLFLKPLRLPGTDSLHLFLHHIPAQAHAYIRHHEPNEATNTLLLLCLSIFVSQAQQQIKSAREAMPKPVRMYVIVK